MPVGADVQWSSEVKNLLQPAAAAALPPLAPIAPPNLLPNVALPQEPHEVDITPFLEMLQRLLAEKASRRETVHGSDFFDLFSDLGIFEALKNNRKDLFAHDDNSMHACARRARDALGTLDIFCKFLTNASIFDCLRKIAACSVSAEASVTLLTSILTPQQLQQLTSDKMLGLHQMAISPIQMLVLKDDLF